MKSEDLDPYDSKSIARFNTDRQLKKNDYKEAVGQIEQALAGNDPAPLNPEEKGMKNNNDFELSADNITDNDNSADESQLQIAEDVPKILTPLPAKKKAVVSKPKYEIFTPEPEAKENDEKVSRSGRKIKEKKMNMDEMDPDEMFTQPRKRFKIEEPKVQKSRDSAAIEEFRASKMHVLMDPVKKNLLENQYEMLNAIQEIKMALGLGQADIERAVELLESFRLKNVSHITDLMLLKYPNTVDSVKRLKKYIGNLNSWGMEESQVEEFQQKAEKIRSIATVVYDQFKVRKRHQKRKRRNLLTFCFTFSHCSASPKTQISGQSLPKNRKFLTKSTTCSTTQTCLKGLAMKVSLKMTKS